MVRDVEDPAEAILGLAMQGKLGAVDIAGSKALALWAAKTACVRALQDAKPRAIPASHYQHIRSHLEPPPNTKVWLGRTEQQIVPFMRHTQFAYLLDSGKASLAHWTSIVYGHLALFVGGVEDAEANAAFTQVTHALDRWKVPKIWPVEADNLQFAEEDIPREMVGRLSLVDIQGKTIEEMSEFVKVEKPADPVH